MTPTRIVVVGGGFVGLYTARRLRRRLGRAAEVIFVTPRNFMTYQPFLAEAANGSLEPRHVVVPLRRVLAGTEVLSARVTRVCHREHCVTVQPAEGPAYDLEYDHLVLAVGAVTRMPPVPGLEESATGFKRIEDAIALRNHVLGRLDLAETTRDPEVRKRALTFVVVGGGFAGVEALGELENLTRTACRYYRHINPADLHWMLVELTGRILHDVSESVGQQAVAELRRRGVDIRLRTGVESAVGGRIRLSDGTDLPAGTLIWSAGVQPHPMLRATDLPIDEKGRVTVGADLRVLGTEDAWSAGDCAAVPDLLNRGVPTPPTAQHAVRQARRLADNLAADLRGKPVRPYKHRYAGSVASLGLYEGVAELYGVRLHGPPAWLLHRTYHLAQMPTLNRKIRIGLDWLLASLFRRDLVSLGAERYPEESTTEAAATPRSHVAVH
ncbi:MAG TPA: FAD-dependent oxidoreductase [Kribbellaceae bacterium]|nr:FAD-dependent oxidoreductase [Kribbellaceae bacterium]